MQRVDLVVAQDVAAVLRGEQPAYPVALERVGSKSA
jgi:hypothetical protein